MMTRVNQEVAKYKEQLVSWYSQHVSYLFGPFYSHLGFGLRSLFRKCIPLQCKTVTPHKSNEAFI